MALFWRVKAWLLRPLLQLLTVFGVRPTSVTYVSAFVVMIGFGHGLWTGQIGFFLWWIWLHVFLDSIDGALARYQGIASLSGALEDLVSDTFGIIVVGAILGHFGLLMPSIAVLFSTLYVALHAFTFAEGALGSPGRVVFRPRMVVYPAMTLDVIYGTSVTAWLVPFLVPILGVSVLCSFLRVRRLLSRFSP